MRVVQIWLAVSFWATAAFGEGQWRVVYNTFTPYSYTDAEGRAAGYGNDLIRALAAQAGATVTFTEVDNPADIIAELNAGRADLTPTLVETEERALAAQFTQPHAAIRMHGFALRSQVDEIRAGWPYDLRIGSTEGAFTETIARQLDGGRIVTSATNADSMLALISGDVDVLIYEKNAFYALLAALDTRKQFEIATPLLADVALSIAVSRQSPGLFPVIDDALAEFTATAEYVALRNESLGFVSPKWATVDVIILLGITATGLLISGAIILTVNRQRAQRALMASMRETAQVQTEAADALREKNHELTRKNKEMEDLIYVVSHDLSSPLVSISGFAKNARRASANGDADKTDAMLVRVQSNVGSMSRLIDGILAVSRVERSDVSTQGVRVSDIVSEVSNAVAMGLEEAGAKLEISGDAVLQTDPDMVQQALQNLVQNALRYACTEPGATLRIVVEDKDDRVWIGVADTGPGFPEVAHERLFEMFQRGPDEKERGSGLGLAIVSRIAERLGATLKIDSTPGQGACVWLAMPRKQTEMEAVAA